LAFSATKQGHLWDSLEIVTPLETRTVASNVSLWCWWLWWWINFSFLRGWYRWSITVSFAGTNEDQIIEVIGGRSNKQRQAIKEIYVKQYQKVNTKLSSVTAAMTRVEILICVSPSAQQSSSRAFLVERTIAVVSCWLHNIIAVCERV